MSFDWSPGNDKWGACADVIWRVCETRHAPWKQGKARLWCVGKTAQAQLASEHWQSLFLLWVLCSTQKDFCRVVRIFSHSSHNSYFFIFAVEAIKIFSQRIVF